MLDKSNSATKKTVLMLDNEPLMIDRRIILEAITLVEASYKVILATRGDGKNPDISFERGIEIRRFPLMKDIKNQKLSARQLIIKRIYSPGNQRLEKRVRKLFSFLPTKLQSLIYGVLCPSFLVAALRNLFPALKQTLGYGFEPLCYLLLLRPLYLKPYFIFLFNRLIKKEEPEIDLFQSQTLSFAKELKPDFIHAHDLPNLALGIEAARQSLSYLIYDAHELYPLQFFSSKNKQSKLADLERRLISNVDAVIAVNRQCEEILRETYTDLSEVVILNNATESPSNFDPSQKKRLWHERFALDEAVQIMVFQGGINPVRNIDPLLRAMKELPDNIHIGFITFNKDIPYYKALTNQLGITHRVHYVIEIPWDEVIYWLSAADVGVMPYQANNINAKISSPNKLFEFIVAGLPIIASSELINVQHAIDAYGLGVHKLLREDDSYVEAIAEMFNEEQGGPERFQHNVLAARHLFTWDNEAPRLVDLYSRLPHKESSIKAITYS